MSGIDEQIAQWAAGDEQAAANIYNMYFERLYRLAYGLVSDAADAEEVAQDALKYALVNIQRFDPSKAQFATWLHTITVSRARDRLRRKRLPRIALAEWFNKGRTLVDKQLLPEAQVERKSGHTELWHAMQQLPAPQREVILLRYWSGQTFPEIAQIVGCSVGTAKSRVRLAHKQLERTVGNSLSKLPTLETIL